MPPVQVFIYITFHSSHSRPPATHKDPGSLRSSPPSSPASTRWESPWSASTTQPAARTHPTRTHAPPRSSSFSKAASRSDSSPPTQTTAISPRPCIKATSSSSPPTPSTTSATPTGKRPPSPLRRSPARTPVPPPSPTRCLVPSRGSVLTSWLSLSPWTSPPSTLCSPSSDDDQGWRVIAGI
ncbi:unnamed protein product [Linum tenue]|uniref:Uncharacterized protein n=1 Tax=Linum tenue TaxID=586396 RepID=A0AAV0QN63_9ROSI|nr:unnamed protein product [Linum tenue]